jgi:hypothetical protein
MSCLSTHLVLALWLSQACTHLPMITMFFGSKVFCDVMFQTSQIVGVLRIDLVAK